VSKKALKLFEGGQAGIIDQRQHLGGHGALDTVDEGIQQRGAGAEIVMEGAAGNLKLVQDIADRHLLEALSEHQALGCVQDFAALSGKFFGFDDASHNCSDNNKQTICLLLCHKWWPSQ